MFFTFATYTLGGSAWKGGVELAAVEEEEPEHA
jgi:hypothetical protein